MLESNACLHKCNDVSSQVTNSKTMSNRMISGGSRIFPRGGREPSRGGVNTPNFPENCMKSKEFGCPGGGRASLTPPLDPPMMMYQYR